MAPEGTASAGGRQHNQAWRTLQDEPGRQTGQESLMTLPQPEQTQQLVRGTKDHSPPPFWEEAATRKPEYRLAGLPGPPGPLACRQRRAAYLRDGQETGRALTRAEAGARAVSAETGPEETPERNRSSKQDGLRKKQGLQGLQAVGAQHQRAPWAPEGTARNASEHSPIRERPNS